MLGVLPEDYPRSQLDKANKTEVQIHRRAAQGRMKVRMNLLMELTSKRGSKISRRSSGQC